MKNIKKILTIAALVGVGTASIAAVKAEQEFQMKMNVIRVLKLEAETEILDFGDISSTTVSNIRATDKIKVTGAPNTQIKFEVTKGEFKNGDSVINYRSFVSKTETGESVGSWGQIGNNGEYNAYMVAQIDHANLEEGAYRGTVTLEVSYS